METNVQSLLVGKRVVYKLNADNSDEGVVQCGVLLKEAMDKPVVSGFMILLDSGQLKHIAYWRVVAVIGKGNDTTQVFTKERSQIEEDKIYSHPLSTTAPDAIDDLPF